MDWARLEQLRRLFLSEPQTGGISDYWSDRELLKLYDETLAQRILWKWRAVWQELSARSWSPTIGTIGDWGCGTGIAVRGLMESPFGATLHQAQIHLLDRSPLAMSYAAEQICTLQPSAMIQTVSGTLPEVDLLLVSHVSNELNAHGRSALLKVAKAAKYVVMVEPGTSAASQFLIELRTMLKKQFRIVAPCSHQNDCPIAQAKGRDWCHQFATAPPSVFHDPFWSEFSRALKVDLRSVPLSYLVLERGDSTDGPMRLGTKVGATRRLKYGQQVLVCSSSGELKPTEAAKLKSLEHSLWSVLDG
jgi:hypothetical protein